MIGRDLRATFFGVVFGHSENDFITPTLRSDRDLLCWTAQGQTAGSLPKTAQAGTAYAQVFRNCLVDQSGTKAGSKSSARAWSNEYSPTNLSGLNRRLPLSQEKMSKRGPQRIWKKQSDMDYTLLRPSLFISSS